MVFWKSSLFLSFAITLFWNAWGNEITMTRSPECDPLAEGTEITLSVSEINVLILTLKNLNQHSRLPQQINGVFVIGFLMGKGFVTKMFQVQQINLWNVHIQGVTMAYLEGLTIRTDVIW